MGLTDCGPVSIELHGAATRRLAKGVKKVNVGDWNMSCLAVILRLLCHAGRHFRTPGAAKGDYNTRAGRKDL